jgi:WD40 repeat protein
MSLPVRGSRLSVATLGALVLATTLIPSANLFADDDPPGGKALDRAAAERPAHVAAIVIGISDYPRLGGDPVPPSYGAGRDAFTFAEWLKHEGGWSPANVLLMSDAGLPNPGANLDDPGNVRPTRENLSEFALGRWLRSRLGPKPGGDDLVVIYFAGQAANFPEARGGVTVDRGYLMALNGRWAIDDAVDALASRGVQVLCLLDTSLEGRPKVVPEGKPGASGRAFLQRITRQPAVSAWLAASSGPAAAATRFSERSPFTAALLQGLGKPSARNNLVACLKSMGGDARLSDQQFAASGNLHPRLTLWARDLRGGDRTAEILLQRGHSNVVSKLAYSPAGDLLFTGSRDSTVRAWRLADRRLLRVLAPHFEGITALAVSADGRVVVAGDGSGAVQAWDYEHGSASNLVVAPLINPKPCEDAAFLAGTAQFVTRDKDGTCRLWTPDKDGNYTPRETSRSALALASADADGPVAFVVAEPKDAPVSRLNRFRGDGTSLGTVDGPGGRVKSASLASDGRRIVAGDGEGRLLLRDETTGKPIPLPKLDTEVVSVSLAGDRVAAAERGRVHIFDLAEGQGPIEQQSIMLPPGTQVFRVLLSRDGRRLAARVDKHPGALAWAIEGAGPPRPITLDRAGSWAAELAFAPDGRTLMAGCQDGSIRSWTLDSGEPGVSLPKGRGRVAALSAGGAGRYLLQMTSDGYAFVWDLQEGGAPKPLHEQGARPTGEWASGSLSPDGKLAYLTNGRRGDIVVFEVASGRSLPERLTPPAELAEPLGRVVVAKNADSGRVAAEVLGKASVCVWDAKGQLIRVVTDVFDRLERERDLIDLDLSPDGKRLLVAGGMGTVAVFDLEAAEPGAPLRPARVATLTVEGYLKPLKEWLSVARLVPASGDAKPLRIALAIGSRTDEGVQSRLMFWGPGDAAPSLLMSSIRGEVGALTSSVDGRWLTAAADRTIEVWNLQADRPRSMRLTPRPNHLERIQALVAQADPPLIISGGDDTQVRFWPLSGPRQNQLLGSMALDQNTGGWVAFTAKLKAPNGPGPGLREYVRFDSSLGGELGVSFIDGDQVRMLDQFGQESRLLALTDFLRRADVPQPPQDVPARDSEPPRIAIEPPQHRLSQASSDQLTVSLGMQPIQELRLYQNTVPIEIEPATWQGRSEVTIPVTLLKGQNRFYAMASIPNALDGRSNEVDLVYRGPEDEPRLHILALGIGQYTDPAMQLRFAEKDARDFADHLRQNDPNAPVRTGYFQVLTNDEINDRSIETEFNKLERAVKGRPQDRVVLFLAGHTDVELRVFSLLLPPFPAANDPRRTKLPLALLYRKLTRLDALNRAVVVDACRTQDIAGDQRIRQIKALVNEQAHGARTTYILAARKGGHLVGEVDALEHGVLTYVLLRGLEAPNLKAPPEAKALDALKAGADLNGDGIITADELATFADMNVPQLVKQFPQLVQRAGPGRSVSRRIEEAESSDFDPVPESFPVFRLAAPGGRR